MSVSRMTRGHHGNKAPAPGQLYSPSNSSVSTSLRAWLL